MGETETPDFYDFGIFGRVPEPQNQLLFIFGDIMIPKQNIKKILVTCFNDVIFINLKMLEIQHFDNFRKNGRRHIPTIR